MILYGRDIDREILLIAEIGVNHEGSISEAKNLIKLAAESGADVVKLQAYTPERYVSSSLRDRFERVKKFAISREDFLELAEYARRQSVGFLSTPLSEDWVDLHSSSCPAIKIASGDLVFDELLKRVSKTGLPIILSTGMSTVDEIDHAVLILRQEICDDLTDRVVLLHCVSAYPPPIEELNIRSIPFLQERYGLRVGYSNHIAYLEPSLAAVAIGAPIIEFHFTDKRSGKNFHDHAISLEPSEVVVLRKSVDRIAHSLGKFEKIVQESEKNNTVQSRKGVIAIKPINAGSIIRSEDLGFARPATEFSASEINLIVGKTALTNVGVGEIIVRNNVVDVS